MLLLRTPIINDFSDDKVELEVFKKCVSENTTNKGIKLIRKYYAATGVK